MELWALWGTTTKEMQRFISVLTKSPFSDGERFGLDCLLWPHLLFEYKATGGITFICFNTLEAKGNAPLV